LNISDYTDFSGSATDLAALAIACGQDFGLPVDPDKTNERLVRYYASEGVIDRPDRVGRDAAYGYRHLLQLLTARRMLQAGTALSVIGPHNSTATTKALEEALAKPLPTAAELLVSSFLQGKSAGRHIARSSPHAFPNVSRNASAMAASAPFKPAKTPPPGPSIVDVLDEVRRIRGEWMGELAKLNALQQPLRDLDDLAKRVDAGLRHAEDAAHVARATGHQLREELHRELLRFQERMEHRWEETLHRLSSQNDLILQRLDELLDRASASTQDGQRKPFEDPTGV
jgi:hypothetical protein